MSNYDHLSPGSLSPLNSSSSDDNSQTIFGIIHYIVAVIVFFVYAKNTFSLGMAILYSLFWEFGIVYSLLS